MATWSLEERMEALEAELAQLKQQISAQAKPKEIPWWEERIGAFAHSEGYAEAERLGREWRKSQPVEGDTDRVA